MRVVLVGARARDVLVVVHFEVVSVLLADPVVDSDVLKVVDCLVLGPGLDFEWRDASLVLDQGLAQVLLLFLEVIDLLV